MIVSFLVILKMHEIDKTKLSDQTKYRLYEIKEIENHFINKINERESYSKKLNKYVTTGIIKKLLTTTIKKQKKHDQILKLAKSKYNSIEALISQALNDIDISHKEFITILSDKDKYEKMKEDMEEQKIVK